MVVLCAVGAEFLHVPAGKRASTVWMMRIQIKKEGFSSGGSGYGGGGSGGAEKNKNKSIK